MVFDIIGYYCMIGKLLHKLCMSLQSECQNLRAKSKIKILRGNRAAYQESIHRHFNCRTLHGSTLYTLAGPTTKQCNW